MAEYDFDENYPFEDIKIKNLKPLQGGTFLANLELNEEPIVIQTPKCKTKHGIHKTSKTTYCDLLLQNDSDFLTNIEKLEEHVRGLILDNSEKWFSDKMSLDDIEYHWNSIVRNYKNSKLMRTYVQKNKRLNKFNIQIYNENEEEINIEKLNNESDIICILEIIGLKFSSQSFYLEAMLRQVMVFNKKEKFKKCMIKVSNAKKTVTYVDEPIHENVNNKNEGVDDTITEKNEVVTNDVSDVSNNDDNQEKTCDNNFENATDISNNDLNNNLENNDDLEIMNDINEKKVDTSNKKQEEQKQEQEQEQEQEQKQEKQEEKTHVEDNNVEDNISEDVAENLVNNVTDDANLDNLEEVKLNIDDNEPEMKLKQPNEVYLDIYRAARLKAKQAKAVAVKAYLEAKKIKKLYMLDEVEFSSSSDEEEINF